MKEKAILSSLVGYKEELKNCKELEADVSGRPIFSSGTCNIVLVFNNAGNWLHMRSNNTHLTLILTYSVMGVVTHVAQFKCSHAACIRSCF